jgi:hypothetical protein
MEAAWTSETLVPYHNTYTVLQLSEDGGSMDLRNIGILPQHLHGVTTRYLDWNHHRLKSLKTRLRFKISVGKPEWKGPGGGWESDTRIDTASQK